MPFKIIYILSKKELLVYLISGTGANIIMAQTTFRSKRLFEILNEIFNIPHQIYQKKSILKIAMRN